MSYSEREAEKDKRIAELEERVAIATDLLNRVVIHGGSGSWSWREMYDWCCDFQGWSGGFGRILYEKSHDACTHRERPGTECGAIGPGDSQEAVHHLFGPDGLLRRVLITERKLDEARELLRSAVLCIENASLGAFCNGNTYGGMDEGEHLTLTLVESAKAALGEEAGDE